MPIPSTKLKIRNLKKSCRNDKREYVNQLATEAERAAYMGNSLYDITKTFSRGKTCKSKQRQRWPEPDQPVTLQPGEDLNIKVDNIKIQEIKKALKSLKNGKAARVNAESKPTEWKKGLLVKLPKKEDLSCCENWRGFTLLPVASKILCRVILNMMKDAVDKDLRDKNADFKSNRSCTDQIAARRIIVEQSVEWQSSLYINFIDFEKAIYSVNRDVMWQLLRHYGLPSKKVNIIKTLYEEFSVQVIHDETSLTDSFEVETGVKQSCLLLSTLFLIVIDWITKQAFERPRGIQGTMFRRLGDLDFGDDIALLSRQIKDIREKTNKLNETGKKIGLKINSKKIKVMKVKTRKGGPITIEGEELEEVEQFTYLESIISNTRGSKEDMKARKSKTRQAFAMLKPFWSSTKNQHPSRFRNEHGSGLVKHGESPKTASLDRHWIGIHKVRENKGAHYIDGGEQD
ncbi:uncharacterized protein LOC134228686 [Saccostrea cucullata]|uniref:uncharacterized protein LOC134228686 n=1 Tax=Saccostrea cuccullata TaxID=36930 RepID=UPI002ED20946